jgi:hypothetical protein
MLRLLNELQTRHHPGAMKGLTSWVAARARPLVENWNNRERRTEVEEQLKALAALGFLAPILALLADKPGHAADAEGLLAASADLDRMDAVLQGLADGGQKRAAFASRMGQEIAAGLGLAAIAVTLILAALG